MQLWEEMCCCKFLRARELLYKYVCACTDAPKSHPPAIILSLEVELNAVLLVAGGVDIFHVMPLAATRLVEFRREGNYLLQKVVNRNKCDSFRAYFYGLFWQSSAEDPSILAASVCCISSSLL